MAQEPAVVLAVDDEPAVLVMTAARLCRAGYTVLEAAGGQEALRVLESRGDVSAIVSDCNMPGMKGTELARIAQTRWPYIRFIATSGHPPDPDLPNGVTFIQKPYRAEVLISTLERILTSPEAAEQMLRDGVLGGSVEATAAAFPDGLAPAIAPSRGLRAHSPQAAASTTMRIVIVEWRIKPGREDELLEYWSTRSTIPDRSGLIHEFLSRVESQEQFPWCVWDLNAAWSTYINVGFWRSAADFQRQLGWLIDDAKRLLAFEAQPRRRMCLAPERWRIGDTPLVMTDHPAAC